MELGLGRIVNFSDAAVAIALTLLVLPLVDIASQIKGHGGMWPLFTANWAAFLAFAISFAVIARFWMVHHAVFDGVVAYNRTVLVINFAWLATIVFLPFSTNMLSYSPDADRSVNALYIGTLLGTSATMLLLEWRLKHTPGLLRTDSAAALDLTNAAASTALFVVVLALVVVFPGVGMLWLLLLGLSGPLGAAIRRVQRRDSAA